MAGGKASSEMKLFNAKESTMTTSSNIDVDENDENIFSGSFDDEESNEDLRTTSVVQGTFTTAEQTGQCNL